MKYNRSNKAHLQADVAFYLNVAIFGDSFYILSYEKKWLRVKVEYVDQNLMYQFE